MKTTNRSTRRWAAAGLLMLAAEWAVAAGADVVYQRAQPDGAVSLTNVPDNDAAYEVLVTAPKSAAAGVPSATAPAPGEIQAPLEASAQRDPTPVDSTSAAARQAPAAALVLDEPEVVKARASVVAGQAFQDITSAGGASARLQAMYQASKSAFASQRPSSGAR
jgi:hypothetical protein